MVTLIYEKLTSFSGNCEKYKSLFMVLCSHNHCLVCFLSARLSLFCNHQTTGSSELREMFLKLNLTLCFTRQTRQLASAHLIWENKNNAHSDPLMASQWSFKLSIEVVSQKLKVTRH